MLGKPAEFLRIIKKAAVDAVKAEKLTEVCFGTVTAVSPMKISVEQKMTLGEAQLLLCRNVTDFEVDISVEWESENESGGSGENAFAEHSHSIKGKKKITVHNGLAVGDEVILLRQQGGQKFVVWDRLI